MAVAEPVRRDTPEPLEARDLSDDPSDWAQVVALVLSCSTASLRSRFALPRAPWCREEILRRYRDALLAGPPDGVALLATAAN